MPVIYTINEESDSDLEHHFEDECTLTASVQLPVDWVTPTAHSSHAKRSCLSGNKRFLFIVGAVAILLASVPIVLFGIYNFSLATESPKAIASGGSAVCDEALLIEANGAPVSGTTTGAKLFGVETCGIQVRTTSGVWFRVQGTGHPLKIIKYDEDAFTNQLSVYYGDCAHLMCAGSDNLRGDVVWNSAEGGAYLLLVHGVGDAAGNFQLVLEEMHGDSSEVAANDLCMDALALTPDGSLGAGTTEFATYDMEGAGTCYQASQTGPGVWYSVVGTGKPLRISTDIYNGLVSVFTGSCDDLQCVTSSNIGRVTEHLSATWQSRLGELYSVLVNTHSEQHQTFKIIVNEDNPFGGRQPFNDWCTHAIGPIPTTGNFIDGSTEYATVDLDGAGTCYAAERAATAKGVWYTVKGTGSGVRAYASESTFIDIAITVFSGECENLVCVNSTSQNKNSKNEFIWVTGSRVLYHILVHGVDEENQGHFELIFEPYTDYFGLLDKPEVQGQGTNSESTSTTLVNDMCDGAIGPITTNGTVTFGSTEHATIFMDGIAQCQSMTGNGGGIWYFVTGTGNTLTVSTTEYSALDAFFSLYSGDCEDLSCEIDDSGNAFAKRSITWQSKVGQNYFLLVQGKLHQRGSFRMKVEEKSTNPPVNDICDQAVGPLPGGKTGTVFRGSTEFAKVDGAFELCHSTDISEKSDASPGVWYSVTGTGSPLGVFAWSHFFVNIAVFKGACGRLECVGDNHGTLTWESVKDERYLILLHGAHGAKGPFEFMVATTNEEHNMATKLVANDLCSTAAGPIKGDITILRGSTENATDDTDGANSCYSTDTASKGIWYRVEGSSGILRATVTDYANFESRISVFKGSCEDLVCVDSTDLPGSAKNSLFWTSMVGDTYFILVHGAGQPTGKFQLKVEALRKPEGGLPSVPNDSCDRSVGPLLADGSILLGSTKNATMNVDNMPVCNGNEVDSPGAFYQLFGTGKRMKISLLDMTNFGANLSIYRGGCGALSCQDHEIYQGSLYVTSVVGESYYLLVHGIEKWHTGSFELAIEVDEKAQAPLGIADTSLIDYFCQTAIGPLPTIAQVFRGTTETATYKNMGGLSCYPTIIAGPAEVYSVNGTGGPLKVSASTSNDFKPMLSVYSGGCGSRTLSCVGEMKTTILDNSVTWNSTKGQDYFLLVHGAQKNVTGSFEFTLQDLSAPAATGVANNGA